MTSRKRCWGAQSGPMPAPQKACHRDCQWTSAREFDVSLEPTWLSGLAPSCPESLARHFAKSAIFACFSHQKVGFNSSECMVELGISQLGPLERVSKKNSTFEGRSVPSVPPRARWKMEECSVQGSTAHTDNSRIWANEPWATAIVHVNHCARAGRRRQCSMVRTDPAERPILWSTPNVPMLGAVHASQLIGEIGNVLRTLISHFSWADHDSINACSCARWSFSIDRGR